MIIDGDQAGGHFGFSLWSAGDVDADGLSDIIVGAKDYNLGNGASFIYHGASLKALLTAPELFSDQRGRRRRALRRRRRR
ncbi:integrin alpha [Microvirga pakistanensis]|uniref:integrin alpha n=1 Tax=Microvirga pakistanensis TaxID=1682650 RepID=UPI003CC7FDCF